MEKLHKKPINVKKNEKERKIRKKPKCGSQMTQKYEIVLFFLGIRNKNRTQKGLEVKPFSTSRKP